MRFPTAITLGVVASALALAACDGPQATAGPNLDPPSFAKISPQLQYTVTLTCSPGNTRTFASIAFRGLFSTFLFCNPGFSNQVTATSFETINWSILLQDATSDVKSCPNKSSGFGTASRTGQFTCKDAKSGVWATLTIEPS